MEYVYVLIQDIRSPFSFVNKGYVIKQKNYNQKMFDVWDLNGFEIKTEELDSKPEWFTRVPKYIEDRKEKIKNL